MIPTISTPGSLLEKSIERASRSVGQRKRSKPEGPRRAARFLHARLGSQSASRAERAGSPRAHEIFFPKLTTSASMSVAVSAAASAFV
jgi:hypothetical protein